MKKAGKNKKIEAKGTRFAKNLISIILITYSSLSIFLIGNTILSSFKTKSDLINNTIGWPKSFSLESYQIVLGQEHFLKYFLNSVLLVGGALVCLELVASMVAYGLSQYEFKGRGLLQSYFLVGLMFPIQLGILPLFVMMTKVHLNNSLLGLVLIYTANLSFPVFTFSRFFKEFPVSLIESARIDGATEFQIYAQMVVPISKPVIFTVGLLNFVQLWNDFFMPLVFLTKMEVRTLTLAVYNYSANFLANWNKIFAAATIALIPVVIIYFMFSEQIVAGLTGGSVKG